MKTPEELFYENMRFSKFILKKGYPNLLFDEDMQQVADLGLWKACLHYDQTSSTKFTTFAGVVINNELFMEMRKRGKVDRFYCIPLSQTFVDADNDNLTYEDLIKDPKGEEFVDFVIFKDAIDRTTQKLSEKEKQVFHGILQGKKQREISEETGISQSYVSRLIERVRGKVSV